MEFKQRLIDHAQRVDSLAASCVSEEATKMFLILPFIDILGYDRNDPREVVPEHHADFSDRYKHKVDFAILQDGQPIIAIECKCATSDLIDHRGQLKAYFNAAPTVKMGVLTNGLIWEFYADSDSPNILDDKPFFTLDLKDVAKGAIDDTTVNGLLPLRKSQFRPEEIGAEARRRHIFRSMARVLQEWFDEPPAEFTRMLMRNCGITHIGSTMMTDYQGMVRQGISDYVNRLILKRLDISGVDVHRLAEQAAPATQQAAAPALAPQAAAVAALPDGESDEAERIVTTETELRVYNWIIRRLSFLVQDEEAFQEISNVQYRDFQVKFVVYYKRERVGRLFEFREAPASVKTQRLRFKVCTPDGADIDIATDDINDIDAPLLAIFTHRVETLKTQR
ncbi:type I restriction enzyme HsdR N-terminal domain-containing protein [Tistrella mobilis]|uniref:Restriction endonuclease type I HsdR N-terminal domain-containing protein n=1 Tax=Tistrella mobilis TaxID=171437 RepID=A0A162M380_9PROT|nr:type I restriction endonuclease [Tistrella mobilis]KYO57922.1 hypothetical protein AUP44_00340 [Tistrella mobilis]